MRMEPDLISAGEAKQGRWGGRGEREGGRGRQEKNNENRCALHSTHRDLSIYEEFFFYSHYIDASVYIYNSYGGGRYGEDLSGSD